MGNSKLKKPLFTNNDKKTNKKKNTSAYKSVFNGAHAHVYPHSTEKFTQLKRPQLCALLSVSADFCEKIHACDFFSANTIWTRKYALANGASFRSK